MNTKISALKKKIELKECQLKAKEELAVRSKEAVKEIKHEIELLNNELAKEEMKEMMELMGEKNLDIEDVKAAISSGVIVGSKSNTDENQTDKIVKELQEINKEEENNAEQGKND